MTDKQIIIDGIRTSKVDFIDNFSIELTNRNIFEREQIADKYFEIILAKEQECEKWQEIVEIFRVKLDTSTIKRMNLEAERNHYCYALKNIVKGKINPCCCAEEYAQKVLKEVKMAVQNLEYNKGLKAIKILAEIKKICNNNDELKGGFNLVDCDKYKLGKHNLAQKIIAKINEVEDE